MAIDLSTLDAREALTAIYIGYYDRAADPAGLAFWEDVVDEDGFNLVSITTLFAAASETNDLFPFFADPASTTPTAFLTQLYLNLFNREPDPAGLAYWANELTAAVNGARADDDPNPGNPVLTVGQIITSIIEGAQAPDDAIITNKIAVALDWTDSAPADLAFDLDGDSGTSARSIIDGVDETQATVTAAKAATDAFFAPAPVPGDTFTLTSGTDAGADFVGTANDDQFDAFMQQNSNAGGVSNSLSSADRLDGGAGTDSLYAVVSKEFLGASGDNTQATDIQPTIKNIEVIEIEARDDTEHNPNVNDTIIIDAKHITDHVEIGSTYSDGDLVIENLTTRTASDESRNTSDITVTMDHTDNFNSDSDASDLTVYFDNDYLLSGQTSEGIAEFFLLDEKAELDRLNGISVEGRLDEIDKNGIRFEINGEIVRVTFDEALIAEDNASEINSHAGFVAALQADLNAKIADGTLPAGTTIDLFEYTTVVTDSSGKTLNRTGLNDGSLSDLIPAIRVTSGDGSPITPLGYEAPAEITGAFDVVGEFRNEFAEQEEPISIDIDLHKVGRGGQGGDLVVGGKSANTEDGIADGIEVFNIDVKGAGADDDNAPAKPSSLGTVTSTGDELEVVNIATHADFVSGDTHASLKIRNGFNELGTDNDGGLESGDLKMVNANSFLGDLTLGTADVAAVVAIPGVGTTGGSQRIINADSIMAMGGGDVTLNAFYTGTEDNQKYTVNTGAGDDSFNILIDGDAVDAVTEGFALDSGAGNDKAVLEVADSFGDVSAPGNPFIAVNTYGSANTSGQGDDDGVSQATTDRLLNLDVKTGAGDDSVEIKGIGNFDIETDTGSDTVFINSGGVKGAGDLWSTSGPSDFASVVVYKADLAISVGGFESVVSIDTGTDFILTEAELNVAIMAAIEQNPEIKQLLTATVGTSDQNLILQALIDGVHEAGIQIHQPQMIFSPAVPVAGSAQVVVSASDMPGLTRDLVAIGTTLSGASVPDSATVTEAFLAGAYGDVAGGMFGNTTAADGYTGIIVTSLDAADDPAGTIVTTINNSDINVGTGANDLAILSAHSGAATAASGGTPWAQSGSSNTLIFDDLNAGKVSIVNWFDDNSNVITSSLAGTAGAAASHLLDFTEFLTNMSTTSGSAASTKLEAIDVVTGLTLDANTMHFTTVDALEALGDAPVADYNFDTITAASLKALIEASAGGITYGPEAAVSTGPGSAGLVAGTTQRTSIIAIENVDAENDTVPLDGITDTLQLDSTNVGEYKFFQIVYGLAAETATTTVEVNEIKTLDFGNSIVTTDALETNLVGTLATDASLLNLA